MDINTEDINKRMSRIIELTSKQFFECDPNKIGFNGKTWERNVQAVVVDGLTVVDRKNAVTKRGIRLFNRWLREKFGYNI